MPNLTETDGSTWPELYQIENGDPQSGGVWDEATKNGLWNAHATALIERTNNLRGRLGGLGENADSISNLDTFSKTGMFRYTASATGNPDSGSVGAVMHTEGASGAAWQSAMGVSGKRYCRVRTAPSTWTDWREAWDSGDAPAQISPSGYQRLPSGLLIQWGAIAHPNGAVITFPMAFPAAVFGITFGEVNAGGIPTNAHLLGYDSMTVAGFTLTSIRYDGLVETVANGGTYLAIGH